MNRECMKMGNVVTHDYFGLPLTAITVDGLIDWLTLPDPATVQPRAAGYLNAHTVNLALQRGSELRPSISQLNLLYPDGMSLVRAGRRRGWEIPERVSAADFFWRFCWAAAARGRSVALIGSWENVVGNCAESLQQQTPGLQIVYTHDGFFDSTREKELVEHLKELKPAITLVGMGSPRQERIALRLRDEAALPTVWCVGALFEYYAPGFRKHAPLWMRKMGLEWAFRFAMEPRRMAGRYLIGNTKFLMRDRFGK